MGNLLAKGAKFLAQQQRRHASSVVTLRRGGASVQLYAVVTRPESATDTAEDLAITSRSRDFIIEVSSYAFGGQPVEPEARTDEIVDTDGRLYEVCDRGTDCWKFSDAQNLRYRVYTRQKAE